MATTPVPRTDSEGGGAELAETGGERVTAL
jgi:hypothetical protein